MIEKVTGISKERVHERTRSQLARMPLSILPFLPVISQRGSTVRSEEKMISDSSMQFSSTRQFLVERFAMISDLFSAFGDAPTILYTFHTVSVRSH